MPGLINQQTGIEETLNTVPRASSPPTGEQMPEEQMQEEAGADRSDEIVTAAMKILYEGNTIKDIVAKIGQSGDVATGLADSAYLIMQILDEKSNGQIPPESLVPSAVEILGLIAEDYEKVSGQEVSGRDIAKATQMMLVRFMGELGMDTSQLERAFAQTNVDQIGQAIDQYRSTEGEIGQPVDDPGAMPEGAEEEMQ